MLEPETSRASPLQAKADGRRQDNSLSLLNLVCVLKGANRTGLGESNMGKPSVRFDEGREGVGHWPGAFEPDLSCLLNCDGFSGGKGMPAFTDAFILYLFNVEQTSKSAVARVSKPAGCTAGEPTLEVGGTAGLETCATLLRLVRAKQIRQILLLRGGLWS